MLEYWLTSRRGPILVELVGRLALVFTFCLTVKNQKKRHEILN
jgi:hypothetical protein